MAINNSFGMITDLRYLSFRDTLTLFSPVLSAASLLHPHLMTHLLLFTHSFLAEISQHYPWYFFSIMFVYVSLLHHSLLQPYQTFPWAQAGKSAASFVKTTLVQACLLVQLKSHFFDMFLCSRSPVLLLQGGISFLTIIWACHLSANFEWMRLKGLNEIFI